MAKSKPSLPTKESWQIVEMSINIPLRGRSVIHGTMTYDDGGDPHSFTHGLLDGEKLAIKDFIINGILDIADIKPAH